MLMPQSSIEICGRWSTALDCVNLGGMGKNGEDLAARKKVIFYGEIKERMAHGLYNVDL
jgi:hypothetical protein